MKIEIQIDESCDEPKIVVMTHRVTEEIREILKKLSEDPSEMLAGFRDERASVLEPNQIYRVYASGGKVMPKRMAAPIFSGCGCMKRSSALQAVPSCEYQTARSSI